MVDSSCCGLWGCRFAVVPGIVMRWKYMTDASGNPVSQVEPIAEETLREEVIRYLEAEEGVSQVSFW